MGLLQYALISSAASPSSIWSRAAEGTFWSQHHTQAQSYCRAKDDLNCLSLVQTPGCTRQQPPPSWKAMPHRWQKDFCARIWQQQVLESKLAQLLFLPKSVCNGGVVWSPASTPWLLQYLQHRNPTEEILWRHQPGQWWLITTYHQEGAHWQAGLLGRATVLQAQPGEPASQQCPAWHLSKRSQGFVPVRNQPWERGTVHWSPSSTLCRLCAFP